MLLCLIPAGGGPAGGQLRLPERSRRTLPALTLLILSATLAVATIGCQGVDADPPATPSAASTTLSAPAETPYPVALTPARSTSTPSGSASSGPPPPAPPFAPAKAAPTGMPSGSASVATPVRLFLPVVGNGGKPDVPAAAAHTPTATPAPTTPTPIPSAPTATPVPPPTPTPRVKPPPSPYKRLQDYPRPAGDSGYGFHLNASPYLPSKDVLQSQAIPLLKALGATWVTVWASSDAHDQVELVQLLVNSGFEVIVRAHDVHTPHPDYVPPMRALERYRAVGVRYFVTGNEPNLTRENPSKAAADLIAQQWVRSADRVKSVGGIPLLYPMSPGGGKDVADHREMLVGILEWLKANDALDTLDGAGVAIHNRPLGKPLDFRDSTSFLEYEWIDDTVARYAGKRLPLFGTEAGYTFGEQVVPSLPRIDGELHKQYNLAIVTGFRDGRWRDSLFTQTFWILSGFGHHDFLADWWVANPLNYGKDLPVVDALRGLPKFTRKFSAPGFQTRPRP